MIAVFKLPIDATASSISILSSLIAVTIEAKEAFTDPAPKANLSVPTTPCPANPTKEAPLPAVVADKSVMKSSVALASASIAVMIASKETATVPAATEIKPLAPALPA